MGIDREMVEANKVRLYGKVEEAVSQYNALMGEAKFGEAKDHANEAAEDLVRLNACLKALCFDEVLKMSDPIAEACKRYTYQVYAIKEAEVEGTALKILKIEQKNKVIALEDLQKFAKANYKIRIGNDPEWLEAVQHLNYLLTIQIAEELGIDPVEIRDCYRIRDVAREYQLGVAHAADGKQQTLAALEKIVNMMLKGTNGYQFSKPGIEEVRFLNRVYSKKGKKCLSVSVANHKQFCGMIMEICHKLLTGEAYSIDYKRVKGK